MNKVFLRGNLTKDVELKDSKTGKKIAKFSIGVRRDFKNSEGNYDSDFINCLAFGNIAEMISKYFHKGSGIIVIGHLQTGSYEKEDGTKVFTTELMVENVEFDRKPVEKKEEKTTTEVVAEVANEDPFEKFGEQIKTENMELPW